MAIGTTIRIKLDSSAVARGFAKIKTGFSRLGSSVAKAGRLMMAPFMKLQVMLAPLLAGVGGFMLFKNASKQAADMESFATAFEQLLGSMDLAAKRMTELEKFSTVTPFEPEEVIKASKMLQSLGGDMLATGRGLRMVGDAAAVANQPLEEVALHIGRLYGAVTSGTSAGESVNRLLELGLMTGTAKRGFENLAAAQKKGTIEAFSNVKAMSLLTKVLGKTDGAMEKLSKTFAGRISTLKGNWNALLAEMGRGLNVGLGDWVDLLNKKLPELKNEFASIGSSIGGYLSTLLNAFKTGQAKSYIAAGFDTAWRSLAEMLKGVFDWAANKMGEAITVAIDGTTIGKAVSGVGNMADKLKYLNPVAYAIGSSGAEVPRIKGGDFWDYQDEARGDFGSQAARRNLAGQGEAANWKQQQDWLRKSGWTDEQMLEVMRNIERKTGTKLTF